MGKILNRELKLLAKYFAAIAVFGALLYLIGHLLLDGPNPVVHIYLNLISMTTEESKSKGAYICSYTSTTIPCDSSILHCSEIVELHEVFAESIHQYAGTFDSDIIFLPDRYRIAIRYSRSMPDSVCIPEISDPYDRTNFFKKDFTGSPPDSLIFDITYNSHPAKLILRKKQELS